VPIRLGRCVPLPTREQVAAWAFIVLDEHYRFGAPGLVEFVSVHDHVRRLESLHLFLLVAFRFDSRRVRSRRALGVQRARLLVRTLLLPLPIRSQRP
jgi:hypothetical protein